MAQFEEVLSVQAQLKKKFVQEATLLDTPPKVLVTVVQLPTGAHEVIVNHEELHTKLLYLIDT
jgi:hypothetical protein